MSTPTKSDQDLITPGRTHNLLFPNSNPLLQRFYNQAPPGV